MNNTGPLEASIKVGRAFGAMIFTFMGAIWIAAGCQLALGANYLVFGLILLIALIIIAMAYRRYRQHLPLSTQLAETPERKKMMRQFNLINAAQWVAILVSVNVLNNIGLSAWTIPAVILIVGLHFLPLARVFNNPPHYLTGSAMIALALSYPFLLPGGGDNPLGCLLTGLILWISAIWAITPTARLSASTLTS